jgi:hypothetical protein
MTNPNQAAGELLPCPWCGGTDVRTELSEICCPIQFCAVARCYECGAAEPNGSSVHDSADDAEREALEYWNDRAQPASSDEPVAYERSIWVDRLIRDYERQGQLNGFSLDVSYDMIKTEIPLYKKVGVQAAQGDAPVTPFKTASIRISTEGVASVHPDDLLRSEKGQRDMALLKNMSTAAQGDAVMVPMDLANRLADDDWRNDVPDDYRPMLMASDGAGAPATFTVGDLRALRVLLSAKGEL